MSGPTDNMDAYTQLNYAPLPAITTTALVPEYTYQPRAGDVIERGRERLVVVCGPDSDGDLDVDRYRRGRWSLQWNRVYNDRWFQPVEISVFVSCMGWRLVARAAQEKNNAK